MPLDAPRDGRLLVRNRDRHYRNAMRERIEYRIESCMRQRELRPCEQFFLWRISHDQRRAGEIRSLDIGQPAAVADDQLHIEPSARIGETTEDRLAAVLQ